MVKADNQHQQRKTLCCAAGQRLAIALLPLLCSRRLQRQPVIAALAERQLASSSIFGEETSGNGGEERAW